MKSTYKNLSIIVLLASSLGMSSCSHQAKEKEGEKSATQGAPSVEVLALKKGILSSSVRIPGELQAFQQVDIYAKVSSFVKKLAVDVGSEVHKGQLLATLEAPELSAQLQEAESKLRAQEAIASASKATYERYKETSKIPGTISPNDLDMARAKQQSDQSQLEAARAAYKTISDMKAYLEIRAPFDGIITARNISAGAYVGPSGKGSEMPLFNLQEQRKLRLVISVPESAVSYLKQHSAIKFTVASLGSRPFQATINRLAGVLDNKLRSQRVEADVDNRHKMLLPGMIAEVNIPLQSQQKTFIIPNSAVLNSTEGLFVIKIVNQQSVWVPISIGRTADGKTEVFGELSEGEQIVVAASEEIRDNSPVGKVTIK